MSKAVMRPIRFLCISLGLLLTGVTAASAEWRSTCKDNVCQLHSEITDQNSGAVLARLYFHQLSPEVSSQANSNYVAIASLPLGLYIPSGVKVDIDEDLSVPAQLLDCTADEGCRAAFELQPPVLEAMKKGNTITFTVVDGRSRTQVAFAVSLIGFTAAYNEFENK